MENSAFETAKNRIDEFMESVIADHREAMECLDCETLLRKGIEAYRWLTEAERQILRSVRAAKIEWDDELDRAFLGLHEQWLSRVPSVEKWITAMQGRGYEIDGLDEFRRTVEDCESWITNYRHSKETVAAWSDWDD